jgi:uncharacterized protein (DUF1810 family)
MDRSSPDPFSLQRFVAAQDRGDAYRHAVKELMNNKKVTHWMWFVFPQISGLGRSVQATTFAISDLQEAAAYFGHPLLGTRLMTCTTLVAKLTPGSAQDVFGVLDAVKLRSSMTLFHFAAVHEPVFQFVIDRHFGGVLDDLTTQLLGL